MPIRLNLLNEAHAAEEARRRDPVKRAVLAGVIVVSCVLGWSSILQLRAVRANSEFSSLQSQWTSMEKDYKKVVENRRLVLETEQKLTTLQALTTNRFLWGSLLNELQFVLSGTEGIHITRLRGEQSFQLQAEVKAKQGQRKGKSGQACHLDRTHHPYDRCTRRQCSARRSGCQTQGHSRHSYHSRSHLTQHHQPSSAAKHFCSAGG